MGIRRQGREAAFQLIYQLDLSGESYESAVDEFWIQTCTPRQAREFTESLTKGVLANLDRIDGLLAEHSHHWKMHRMNTVDRSILRLGVYELIFCGDTPTKVIINEAIEIGKKYGTTESGSFINGILDKISKEVRQEDEEEG